MILSNTFSRKHQYPVKARMLDLTIVRILRRLRYGAKSNVDMVNMVLPARLRAYLIKSKLAFPSWLVLRVAYSVVCRA